MAMDAPDPRILQNWEDAFQYPIPTVRSMEKKLRTAIDESHEKLRTLVGASYRDLLGTARTIVVVNSQMHSVETLLAEAGRKCDSRVLLRIGTQYARFDGDRRAEYNVRLALASQLSVLRNCSATVLSFLRTNGSTLMAAKLLVVSRLLHKTLSQSSDQGAEIKSLGKRLATLRQRLLRHIDRRLIRSDTDTSQLVQDLTAFSLATSSNHADVLKHFHHLRQEAVARSTLEGPDIRNSLLKRIQLFLNTLKESRAIFPDLLGSSLKHLAATPLLQDEAILGLEELELDINERWFADDVRHFIPWERHDSLQRAQAADLRRSWTRECFEMLLARIAKDVSMGSDLHVVVDVRNQALQMLLSSRELPRELDARTAAASFGAPFMTRAKDLIRNTLLDLQESFCSAVLHTFEHWNTLAFVKSNQSLWDISLYAMDIEDGASQFRQAIIERKTGVSRQVDGVMIVLEKGSKQLESIQRLVRQMQETRWDDDLDEDAFDDGVDQQSVQHLFSKTQPEDLESTIACGFHDLVFGIEKTLTKDIRETWLGCSDSASPGVFMLRIIRELRLRLPRLMSNVEMKTSPQLFCQSLVETLKDQVAEPISELSCTAWSKSLSIFTKSRQSARSLWAGTPLLPVQPTPATFNFLREVLKAMEALGPDLWSPDVVARLKISLQKSAAIAVQGAVDDLEATTSSPEQMTNGVTEEHVSIARHNHDADHEETHDASSHMSQDPMRNQKGEQQEPGQTDLDNESPHSEIPFAKHEEKMDKLMQMLFDTQYLQIALTVAEAANGPVPTSAEAQPLAAVVERLSKRIDISDAACARLRKSTSDYWRRTYLLFGLLAA